MTNERKKSVVVLGGGTGIHSILRGLKKYHEAIGVTAVVNMSDSGGSTGRLRDEFGQLPMGDVRMALIALARESNQQDKLLRELFLHRFDKGNGLYGHNFGNLFMTALTEMLGDEANAVKAASNLLQVRGTVLPVTVDNIHLVAEYDDGMVLEGEHLIDEPSSDRYGHKIVKLSSNPVGKISSEAKVAIEQADLIVLGPGDLYSSLISILIIDGVSDAIKNSQAELLYNVNLMTRPGQTDDFGLFEHVEEIVKYADKHPDYISFNSAKLDPKLLKHYARKNQFPVEFNRAPEYGEILKQDLLSQEPVQQRKGDTIKRSLLRNDGDKFAKVILSLL